MYRIIEDLQGVTEIVVIDLTSGLGTEAYQEENIKILPINDKTEILYPGTRVLWKPLKEVNPDNIVGYQNTIASNPAWLGDLIIFQDYGNDGPSSELGFDERVLFPYLTLGSESVGYYDGAISIIYRVDSKLYVFKICIDPVKPDITRIRKKRPTNIDYGLTSEEPDSKVIVRVLFNYEDVPKPTWKNIMIPGITAWDIHKPSWIKEILNCI